MAIDKIKFAQFLQEQGAWQGDRCKDAINTADGDIIAAAIAGSLLVQLQHAAGAKPLSSKDLQIVIDAFMASSKMEEREDRMGGYQFHRQGSGQ